MKACWQRKLLGEQFKTATGSTPSKSNSAFFGGDIPLVKPPELLDGQIFSAADSLTPLGAKEARLLPIGSVLISCIGILGKVGIASVPVSFNQQINAIIPKPDIADPRFMFYQALSPNFKDQLYSRSSGTTVPIVNKSKFNEIEIVLPPLEEQRRIVAVLDKGFEGIATATANAQKNLTNARALFESYLGSVFSARTKEWTVKRLGSVATLQRGFDLPTQDRVSGNVPLVSSSGIIARVEKAKVIAPGVTTGRSGSIGNVFYIDEDFWPLNTSLYVKDFHNNNPRFIFWLLRDFDLSKFATGSGVPTLNRNFVHDEEVWIPHDTDVQSRLANSFDQLDLQCAKIDAVVSKKLLALSELKQSLLQKAFAGELT